MLATIIIQCCSCKKIDRRGEFYELSNTILKYIEKNYSISHTYCPKCFDREQKKYGLGKYKKK